MKFLRWERRHTADPTCMRAFDGGGETHDESMRTTNIDRRSALQDSVQVGDGSMANVTVIQQRADVDVLKAVAAGQSDAVKTMTHAGADVIKSVGGAVVDINRDTLAANTHSFDSLVRAGGALVDKLIDANAATTQGVISSYRPTDGNNAAVAKWGMAAAAAVAAVLLMKGK